jgi:DNA-binding MarR family transcriptional regulator
VATPRRQPFYTARSWRLDNSVGYLVYRLRDSLTRCIDEQMALHGLTDAQWRPLFLVGLGRAQNAAELSQLMGVNAGAVTRTIDRLQAKGLMRRTRSRVDRRVVRLALTDSGRQAVSVVPGVIARANNLHLQGLSRQEFDTLKALLRRMLDNGGGESTARATRR